MRHGHRRAWEEGDFPVAEGCAGSVLSLPPYPHLEKKQVERLCEVLREIAGSRNSAALPMSK